MENIFDRKWTKTPIGCLTFIFYQNISYDKMHFGFFIFMCRNYLFENTSLEISHNLIVEICHFLLLFWGEKCEKVAVMHDGMFQLRFQDLFTKTPFLISSR